MKQIQEKKKAPNWASKQTNKQNMAINGQKHPFQINVYEH